MFIIYDQRFNQNEWVILAVLVIEIILVWKTPKRFSTKQTLIYLIYFTFLGMIFDHTISIEPFDYYDVNDTSLYELMDFLSYLTFGPFGYFFVYLLDYFKIKTSYQPIYILLWSLDAMLNEYITQALGVYHYKNGYTIYYSFTIYLLVFTSLLCLYRYLKKVKTD